MDINCNRCFRSLSFRREFRVWRWRWRRLHLNFGRVKIFWNRREERKSLKRSRRFQWSEQNPWSINTHSVVRLFCTASTVCERILRSPTFKRPHLIAWCIANIHHLHCFVSYYLNFESYDSRPCFGGQTSLSKTKGQKNSFERVSIGCTCWVRTSKLVDRQRNYKLL